MIRPFNIAIPQSRLDVLTARFGSYDWSQLPDAGGWSAGVGKADLKRLVDYFLDAYDWRATERRLNELPNFIVDVEGVPIHLLHVKGGGSKSPILLLHGWPGSYLEFGGLWEALAADGHDVVIPSLPGFAFSNPIKQVIGPRRAAQLMHNLMSQLFGETKYVVQGGDWGAGIASWMAHLQPAALLGIHINMVTLFADDAVPTTLAEKDALDRRDEILTWETGYNLEQETRPQTLGVSLSDSPVGAAGWILEKFGKWADLPTRDDGSPDLWSKFSEDDLLDNIMLYLAPSAVVTSTWIYHGKRLEKSNRYPAGTRIEVPVGVAAFPDPVFVPSPRSYVEKTYNVVHWSDMPRGGHFAAMEEPALMLGDLRRFIGSLAGDIRHG